MVFSGIKWCWYSDNHSNVLKCKDCFAIGQMCPMVGAKVPSEGMLSRLICGRLFVDWFFNVKLFHFPVKSFAVYLQGFCHISLMKIVFGKSR